MKLVLMAVAMIALGIAQAHAGNSVFDPPLDTRTQVFPETKSDAKTTLTCRDYPHFTVKEIDEGDIGASQLSMIPVAGGRRPPCQRDNLPTEKVVKQDDWFGYFKGVKGDFVFFDAADISRAGLEFAVFTADAEKLFEDSAQGDLKSATVKGGTLAVSYTRGFAGECSVPRDGAKCWEQIAAAAGIDKAAEPDCAATYAKFDHLAAKGYCEQTHDKSPDCVAAHLKEMDAQHWDANPSVVSFRVQTVLGAGKPMIKVLSGALSCWPED